MKSRFQETIFLQVFFVISFFTLSCSQKEVSQKSIAVFVPGVIADSPIYEMLVHGVKTGVTSFNKEHKKMFHLQLWKQEPIKQNGLQNSFHLHQKQSTI